MGTEDKKIIINFLEGHADALALLIERNSFYTSPIWSGSGMRERLAAGRFIPLTSAQRFLAGDMYVSTISVQAEYPDSMAEIQQQITDLLLARHHISDATLADFSVMNQADIVATASRITQTFTILLSAVAGISLIVGGIGIMNMMLTNVTERTKEIGLRKAIGAKRRDIMLQFLSEAAMLTFLGEHLEYSSVG